MHKISYSDRSPASSGRRTTGSIDPYFGRSSSSRSWAPSLASADISGAAASYSIANENRLFSESCNNSSSNNRIGDDTSPLGGPSTSEDINLVPVSPIKEECNSPERKPSVLDSKQQSTKLKLPITNSCGSDRSYTTTSGSFSVFREDFSGGNENKHFSGVSLKSNEIYPNSERIVNKSIRGHGELSLSARHEIPHSARDKVRALINCI